MHFGGIKMKYCQKCGKELLDEAVICVGCGCPVEAPKAAPEAAESVDGASLVQTLSTRIKVNAIIWLAIAGIQVLLGLTVDWWILIVGVLNAISAFQDLSYSKAVLQNQNGIVAKHAPLTSPIITAVYNVVGGFVFGIAGTIYYLIAIRKFVMDNKEAFLALETAEEEPVAEQKTEEK